MNQKTGTIVLPCSCVHPAQDRLYGRGNRLHNCGPKNSPTKNIGAVCTVCDRKKTQP